MGLAFLGLRCQNVGVGKINKMGLGYQDNCRISAKFYNDSNNTLHEIALVLPYKQMAIIL